MPESGGEYAFIREAYGDLPAFLYMWTWFTVAKPASIATITTGLARSPRHFLPPRWLRPPGHRAPSSGSQIFAITMTWLMTGLNNIGIRDAANFQLVFTWLKVLADPGHRCHLLQPSSARLAGKLRHCVHRRTRWLRRLHDRAHRRAVGLRRLERRHTWPAKSATRNATCRSRCSAASASSASSICSINAAIQYMLPAAAIAAADRPAAEAMRMVAGHRRSRTGHHRHGGQHLRHLRRHHRCPVPVCPSPPRAMASSSSRSQSPSALPNTLRRPDPAGLLSTLLLLAMGRFQALF